MSYDQVRSVLQTVRAFHRELRETCQRLAQQTDDERLELLMEGVQQHERRFEIALARFERAEAEAVLDTWLQYTPTEQVQSALESAQLADANRVADVAEFVWEFEQALIDLYRQLAESTTAPRVQELFQALLEQEEHKTGKYAWSLEEFQDGALDAPATDV